MITDDLNMGVCTSPKPLEQHSGSTPSKGSQRCISIHADGDEACSAFLEAAQGPAHAVDPLYIHKTSMQAPQGSCGVVYDAVMELHIREGKGSRCQLLLTVPLCFPTRASNKLFRCFAIAGLLYCSFAS
jgi:hypothetical protein